MKIIFFKSKLSHHTNKRVSFFCYWKSSNWHSIPYHITILEWLINLILQNDHSIMISNLIEMKFNFFHFNFQNIVFIYHWDEINMHVVLFNRFVFFFCKLIICYIIDTFMIYFMIILRLVATEFFVIEIYLWIFLCNAN